MAVANFRLFVGGPYLPYRERLVAAAVSDPDLRPRFRQVEAFDDDFITSQDQGPQSWRNYLRICDAAIFILPNDRSGSKIGGKFYTALELKLAVLSGLPTILIEEQGATATELQETVERIFTENRPSIRLRPRRPATRVSERIILQGFKRACQKIITHWGDLLHEMDKWQASLTQRLPAPERPIDRDASDRKTFGGEGPETHYSASLIACWNFRRHFFDDPELPRHLLRAYLFITRPSLLPRDVKDAIKGTDAWERIRLLAGLSRGAFQAYAKLPPLSQALFESLSDWRQLSLIRFLREAAVASRYNLDFASDWHLGRWALAFYSLRGSTIDKGGKQLLDLAIGIVPGASFALRARESKSCDGFGAALKELELAAGGPANPGAQLALGVYLASAKEWTKAKMLIRKAATGHERVPDKRDAYIHSMILLACVKKGSSRRKVFDELASAYSSWNKVAHPPYRAFAGIALQKPMAGWDEIMSKVRRSRRTK